MSGYLLHLLVYCILAAAIYMLTQPSPKTLAASLLIGGFYALLPDIDMPSSKMRKLIETIALLSVMILLTAYLLTEDMLYIYASIFATLIVYLLWTVKHRGFFHTVAAGLIFSLPFLLIEPMYFIYAFAGYMSHLFLDRKIFSLI